jgi:hypothetical protein
MVVGEEEELGPVGQWVVGAEAAGTQRRGVGRLARARPRGRGACACGWCSRSRRMRPACPGSPGAHGRRRGGHRGRAGQRSRGPVDDDAPTVRAWGSGRSPTTSYHMPDDR